MSVDSSVVPLVEALKEPEPVRDEGHSDVVGVRRSTLFRQVDLGWDLPVWTLAIGTWSEVEALNDTKHAQRSHD